MSHPRPWPASFSFRSLFPDSPGFAGFPTRLPHPPGGGRREEGGLHCCEAARSSSASPWRAAVGGSGPCLDSDRVLFPLARSPFLLPPPSSLLPRRSRGGGGGGGRLRPGLQSEDGKPSFRDGIIEGVGPLNIRTGSIPVGGGTRSSGPGREEGGGLRTED